MSNLKKLPRKKLLLAAIIIAAILCAAGMYYYFMPDKDCISYYGQNGKELLYKECW